MQLYLVLGGLALAGLGLLVWLAMRSGRKEAQREFLAKAVDTAKEAKEIDDEVASVASSDLDDELRDSFK